MGCEGLEKKLSAVTNLGTYREANLEIRSSVTTRNSFAYLSV